jgi:hypothetical protein
MPYDRSSKVKEEAWVQFGMPGHDDEYVLRLKSDKNISYELADKVMNELGADWRVLRRGGRLELSSKKKAGLRDDEKIKSSIQKAVLEKYDLHFEF